MNDFKSYSQQGKSRSDDAVDKNGDLNKGDLNKGYANGGGNGEADLKQATDMMTMVAKAFNGKSEGQIFKTILAQAEEGKRNGTLTNADIDNFYNTVAPMLDGYKRKKLKEIIAKLKEI